MPNPAKASYQDYGHRQDEARCVLPVAVLPAVLLAREVKEREIDAGRPERMAAGVSVLESAPRRLNVRNMERPRLMVRTLQETEQRYRRVADERYGEGLLQIQEVVRYAYADHEADLVAKLTDNLKQQVQMACRVILPDASQQRQRHFEEVLFRHHVDDDERYQNYEQVLDLALPIKRSEIVIVGVLIRVRAGFCVLLAIMRLVLVFSGVGLTLAAISRFDHLLTYALFIILHFHFFSFRKNY